METTQTVGTNTFATNYFVYGSTTSILINSVVSVVAAATAKKDDVVVTATDGIITTWNGNSNSNTNDITAPFLSSLTPKNQVLKVPIESNIVASFSEPIKRGAGAIVIKTVAGVTVETFNQNSSNVTISGNQLTINPSADLLFNTTYKIEFATDSVKDIAGNAFAGTQSYSFTTRSPNIAPIGNVKITGVAAQGQCLTASNDLTDADGLDTFSYQWYADGQLIFGASNIDYVLTQSDVSKKISVKVSYLDKEGTSESVSSEQTLPVQEVNNKPDLKSVILPGIVKTNLGGSYDKASCSIIQADEKILVGGYSDSNLLIVRYNSDGTLDKTFDSDGKLLVAQKYAGSVQTLMQQPDGKVLVFGSSYQSSNSVQVFRVNVDGSIDDKFGTNGQLILNGYISIYAANFLDDGIYLKAIKSNSSNSLFKLSPNGVVDATFVERNLGASYLGFLQDKNNILVVQIGVVDEGQGYKFIISKYDATNYMPVDLAINEATLSTVKRLIDLWTAKQYGSPDSNSIAIDKFMVNAGDVDISVRMWEPLTNLTVDSFKLQKEASNQISGFMPSATEKIAQLKTSFGNAGVAVADVSPLDTSVGLMVQKDGKVVVAGNAIASSDNFKLLSYTSQGSWSSSGASKQELILARFNADGTLDQDFGISPQDNGSVSYTKGGSAVVLNPLVQVEDLDYQAAGTYAGATLTLKRHGGVSAQDTFSLSTQGTTLNVLANNDITNNGQVIGTFKSEAGTLSLAFKGAGATQTVVNQVLQHIQYKNMAFAPPANVQIDWIFSDGIASEIGLSNVALIDLSKTVKALAKHWKESTQTPTDTKKADAVNLTDAIAILKMIVGLNVNSNNTPLSPYQAIAADFDQSGDVGLTDAIGLLKMVVGLSAPTPTWKYYDDTKLASAYTSAQSLNPKGWTTTAVMSDTGTADSSVKLIGVLTGDVDGSWTGV